MIKPRKIVDLLLMHYDWIGQGWGRFWELLEDKTIKQNELQELGDIVAYDKPGRIDDEEKIIFQTGGIPVEDVAWGTTIYREAVKKNLGTLMKLWDKPHWF